MTPSEAAQRAGLSQSALSRLEDGSRWPTKRTVAKICKGWNVTAQVFFMTISDNIRNIPSEAWKGVLDDYSDDYE